MQKTDMSWHGMLEVGHIIHIGTGSRNRSHIEIENGVCWHVRLEIDNTSVPRRLCVASRGGSYELASDV